MTFVHKLEKVCEKNYRVVPLVKDSSPAYSMTDSDAHPISQYQSHFMSCRQQRKLHH